jgi:hypothetical protein
MLVDGGKFCVEGFARLKDSQELKNFDFAGSINGHIICFAILRLVFQNSFVVRCFGG